MVEKTEAEALVLATATVTSCDVFIPAGSIIMMVCAEGVSMLRAGKPAPESTYDLAAAAMLSDSLSSLPEETKAAMREKNMRLKTYCSGAPEFPCSSEIENINERFNELNGIDNQ